MNLTQKSPELGPVLALGAHPDDIEFACGGVIAKEARLGRGAHFVVCSHGEAASHGTPDERTLEAAKGAQILGASLEFIELDGDAHLEVKPAHAMKLAEIIRRVRPKIVLAPSLSVNQHPDHWRLGQLAREAARLARYGGIIAELKDQPAHLIGQILFYAVTPDAEPEDMTAVLVDVSDVVELWKAAMEAHASQMATRNYVEMQLARARVNGLCAGVEYAIALFAGDPIVMDSLEHLGRGARRF